MSIQEYAEDRDAAFVAFVNDGDFVFTNCVFPTEVYNTFGVKSADSQFSVKDIKIYELK